MYRPRSPLDAGTTATGCDPSDFAAVLGSSCVSCIWHYAPFWILDPSSYLYPLSFSTVILGMITKFLPLDPQSNCQNHCLGLSDHPYFSKSICVVTPDEPLKVRLRTRLIGLFLTNNHFAVQLCVWQAGCKTNLSGCLTAPTPSPVPSLIPTSAPTTAPPTPSPSLKSDDG